MLAVPAVALGLGGCGSARCADEVVQHEPSPWGPRTAIVFVRSCGETGGGTTQVALIGGADAGTRGHSVVFVADDDHGAAPPGRGGGPPVRVRWIDAGHLEVAHHPRARVVRNAAAHGDVRITYVPLR